MSRDLTDPDLSRATCGGTFLLCLGVLMYELVLTRIFSVLMYYHFASMAISLALFGMGLAALVVQLRPNWFKRGDADFLAARCAVFFGLSLILLFSVFVLFRWQPQIGFKVLSVFHQPFYQPFQQGTNDLSLPVGLLLTLLAFYLLTALPFFCAGLSLTLLFTHYSSNFNRLYFWDLLGAGSGCLLVILLLKLLGGVTTLIVIGGVGILAGVLLLPRDVAIVHRVGALVLIAILLIVGVGHYLTGFAEVRFVRGRYEPKLLWSAWNSFSRVAVYPADSHNLEQAWGLSRTYRGAIPDQLGMVVDDTGYTTMYRWKEGADLEYFHKNLVSLAYRLHPHASSLIIGPGGGKDILTALASDAKKITAVEINPLIVEAVNDQFGSFTGELFRHPKIELVVDEGRSFVRRDSNLYDIIQASIVFGRMAPSAGAFTLSENTLYTIEAFSDYWDHLEDDGILTISRHIFEREALRLVSLGVSLLQQKGVANPADHIVVIRERGLANFMLKRTPFTAGELSRLRQISNDLEFQEVLMPDRHNGMGPFQKLIDSRGSQDFFAAYPFDISPVDDNRPFFHYMIKPADFIDLFSFPAQSKFGDRAILTLRNLLVVVSLCVAIFLVLPLMVWQREGLKGRGSGWRIFYFSCLGLGFMFIEIGLLRQFILFLGSPIYSLAVVLCALLISSGFGSLATAWVKPVVLDRCLPMILLGVGLLSIGYTFGLADLLDLWIVQPIQYRCLLAGLLLTPLGLLMGMPMPLGIRHFHADNSTIPWSWGINSATSVLGAILAVVVAMNLGFMMTLFTGTACYLLSLVPVIIKSRNSRS